MNVELLAAAQAELDHAYTWYETQRKGLGAQFLNEFDAAVRRLAAYPHAYQSLGKGVRRCLVKQFPYGVLYGMDKDKIVIIAVAHLHRKPDYWEDRTK
jgi:plasmid stabilization system protein ParE